MERIGAPARTRDRGPERRDVLDEREFFGRLPGMNPTEHHSIPRLPLAVHPSPVFLAGPLLPAAALFLSGAVRGGMTLGQSIPATILLVGTYLISRWYRGAALILDDHGISLGDRTVRYDGRYSRTASSALNSWASP